VEEKGSGRVPIKLYILGTHEVEYIEISCRFAYLGASYMAIPLCLNLSGRLPEIIVASITSA